MTISVSYMLEHPQSDSDTIRAVVEKLRQRAIDLGFRQVSDLFCLLNEDDILGSEYGKRFDEKPILPNAVIYFTGALFDSQPAEIGLRSDPLQIMAGGVAIPYGVAEWTWSAVVRTRDLKTLSQLFNFAAENGLWTSMSFAGTTIECCRDADGGVKYEQWVETPDDS